MLFLNQFLKRLIRKGTLRIIDAGGKTYDYEGDIPGQDVTIKFHSRLTPWRLFFNPNLKLGEEYMNGNITVEAGGGIYEVIEILSENVEMMGFHKLGTLQQAYRRVFRRFHQSNKLGLARKNVAHHYDLSDELYDLFLDNDRQYSCAYFEDPKDDLETAQENKKLHLAAKLLIEPDSRILDIGSGWGGLGLFLSQFTSGEVVGLTLSTEQHKVSNRRAREHGVGDRVHFKLQDYREEDGTYDRIISVGMFEHVGIGYYDTYFSKVRDMLTEDGVAVLHTIGRAGPPGSTNAWVRKYIFPGGYIPALSETMQSIERVGLVTTDVEILRLHYADTLKHWRERFVANWDKVKQLYDERFCRMWEFYLAGSEASFRVMGMVVFQIQMARKQDAVPLTREYMTDWERANKAARKYAGKGAKAA